MALNIVRVRILNDTARVFRRTQNNLLLIYMNLTRGSNTCNWLGRVMGFPGVRWALGTCQIYPC